jgi:glycosyltransferase involved in cell wall biosynthesis
VIVDAPLLSVVVPAYQAGGVLPECLGALASSAFPRERWELVVVDDASTDETGQIAARWADRVVTLRSPARGPAFARNRGVEACAGAWIVFIDADVAVHPGTLVRFAKVIEDNANLDAIVGAYDDVPAAPGFLSQYRNLVHHYTHLQGGGDVATFWAGCGAVRRAAFTKVGGFDDTRYRWPQIEDIELGYRLRDQGGRIRLCPEIQATHLKRWTFRDAVRTDVWGRGVPWVRLLLERGELSVGATLNLRRGERTKTALVGLALVLLLGAVLWRRMEPAVLAGAVSVAVALSNMKQFAWFAQRRGALFALAAVPMNLWYYVVSGTCVVLAIGLHLMDGRSRGERAV